MAETLPEVGWRARFDSSIAWVPKLELDGILQQFYAELIKSDGQVYEPESLKVMQAALDWHLREKGCSYSILKDPEFSNSRKVLNGKAIVLQENGKGKRPRKADALTENEEELLWSCGMLKTSNPTSLNYTVFLLFSQHFATRGRQEHHQLCIEDLLNCERCHNWAHFPRWVGWRANKDKTRWSSQKAKTSGAEADEDRWT